jgi:hypothetical protein
MAQQQEVTDGSVKPPIRFCYMTSGGDCSGMNAAVRAVVRRGILSGTCACCFEVTESQPKLIF